MSGKALDEVVRLELRPEGFDEPFACGRVRQAWFRPGKRRNSRDQRLRIGKSTSLSSMLPCESGAGRAGEGGQLSTHCVVGARCAGFPRSERER